LGRDGACSPFPHRRQSRHTQTDKPRLNIFAYLKGAFA
jgi:hypothetical protein